MALQTQPDLDELFRPERPDDLIGIEIVFSRDGRGQEEGYYWTPEGWQSFQNCYKGEVIDWLAYNGKNMPKGLYLTVQSDAFRCPVMVHESRFVAYGFEVEATAFAAAS
jgi:hypothetical protein